MHIKKEKKNEPKGNKMQNGGVMYLRQHRKTRCQAAILITKLQHCTLLLIHKIQYCKCRFYTMLTLVVANLIAQDFIYK